MVPVVPVVPVVVPVLPLPVEPVVVPVLPLPLPLPPTSALLSGVNTVSYTHLTLPTKA